MANPKARTVRTVTVEVAGGAQLRRALKGIDPDLNKILPRVFKDIAEKAAAATRARMTDFQHPSGRAKSSVVAKSTSTYAAVWAGDGVPYYPWLDFGGWTGRRHDATRRKSKWVRSITSADFATKGGSIYREWMGKGGSGDQEGRYVYPALRGYQDEAKREAIEAMEHVVHEAGLETTEGA